MKKNGKYLFLLMLLVSTMTVGECIASNNSKGGQRYPAVDNSKLIAIPKNASIKKVDINFDGLDDVIANYPWGNSEIYLNCGNERYYPLIQSNMRLQVESTKSNGWLDITFNYDEMNWAYDASTMIDGQFYRSGFLPFSTEDDNDELIFKYDGSSYKLPFKYCKGLKIYAPRYQFKPEIKITEKSAIQRVDLIYLDLAHGKYKIVSDDQPECLFTEIFFTDLNNDGALDGVLYYFDTHGSGAAAYAGLLLNDGDNYFIYAGYVELGYSGIPFTRFRSEEITVDGIRFTAIVSKGPVLRPGEKRFTPAGSVELYLYQPKLKKFFRLTAMPGRDKNTFVPVDKKKFDDIVNPPVLRNIPASWENSIKETKADESAITKLIDNYEKSLVNAINSGNFSLVEKYLTLGSNLYKSQKNLVANLYKKGTKEKLVEFKVNDIKTTSKPDVYQVYVTEKIGIKRADKADFTISEFKWVYTVVFDGAQYSLSDIAK